MPGSEHLICSICGQLFRDEDTVVKYRAWPQLEKLCHVTCAMALAKDAGKAKALAVRDIVLQGEGELSNAVARSVYYRHKSEEACIIAESMKNEDVKQFMMSVAADYLMVAKMVERLLRNDPISASR
jgi:hypothetical protein